MLLNQIVLPRPPIEEIRFSRSQYWSSKGKMETAANFAAKKMPF